MIYHRALIDLARHDSFYPKACQPDRAKTIATWRSVCEAAGGGATGGAPFRAVLRLERRISREGMVSVGGNFYSVPDATRRRLVEVHTLAEEVRLFEDGTLIAAHPVREGRHQRHVAPGHRTASAEARRRANNRGAVLGRIGDRGPPRSLEFYDAVGRRLARETRA